MSTTTMMDPSGSGVPFTPLPRPEPLSSLTAAAKRLTAKRIARGSAGAREEWQEDAWDMHDLVGEQRFLAHTLAGRLSQARFYAGLLPEDSTEDVDVATDQRAIDVVEALTRGVHFSQIVGRMGVNLFIPGDCYLIGIPPGVTEVEGDATLLPAPDQGISPIGVTDGGDDLLDGIDLSTLEWNLYSNSEVSFDREGNVSVQVGEGRESKVTRNADDVVIVRVWRPHPRYHWQADSPTRSSLPVLRELVGLTMHISAQVDSRLAGAGMLLIPESADRAVRQQMGGDDSDGGDSPLATSLMEAMITPISDRASAAAVVPLMPVVPDESVDKFRHMTFSGPLDAEARTLRDEAIRRLALGQDCPPELLLGVGSMNHWGAWLVREDVVTTHLEPSLALICDALTSQLLWPVLIQNGMDEDEAHRHVIWYDVDHMIMRPDRSKDAKDLHVAGVLSDEALRNATGFDESHAPMTIETEQAVTLALDLVKQAPSLMANPGLSVIVEQIRAMLNGEPVTSAEEIVGGTPSDDGEEEEAPDSEEAGAGAQEEGPPETSGEDANGPVPDGLAASALEAARTAAPRRAGTAPTSLMLRSGQGAK